jgi:hypothetical protein
VIPSRIFTPSSNAFIMFCTEISIIQPLYHSCCNNKQISYNKKQRYDICIKPI